jgi:prepilin peptidase CpaA
MELQVDLRPVKGQDEQADRRGKSTVMLLVWLSLAVAAASSFEDLRSRRVPNALTVTAFTGGLAARSYLYGWSGATDGLIGAAIGFACLFVFFLLGGMGGGDVKLMAAFGAIVGRNQVVMAVVMTALIGAVIALIYLLVKKVRRAVTGGEAGGPETRPDRKDFIPYAPAISLGVMLSFLSEDELWTSV